MVKTISLFQESGNESHAGFLQRFLDLAREICRQEPAISGCHLTITVESPPSVSIIPFLKKKVAVLSVYSDTPFIPETVREAPGLEGVYSVEEAIPVAYQRNWPIGTPAPGECLLTLFRKRKGLDYATFIHRWHHGHTPLSLKVHPLWNYNRNVVREKLTESGPWFDGIVEEQVRERADLLNPFRFFGPPLIIIPRMIAVYRDVKGFIDYGSIRTYLTRGYWIQ